MLPHERVPHVHHLLLILSHIHEIIEHLRESKDLQIVKCSENSEFDWRTDIQSNSTRKISFIVFLSDLKDYDGGQITFSMIEPKVDEVFQKKGTVLFFSLIVV